MVYSCISISLTIIRKVTTNLGRVRHFGYYRVVRQHHCKPQPRGNETPCRWIRISDDRSATIDGIFTDANVYLRSGAIMTIGVAQHSQVSQTEDGTDVAGPKYLEIPPSVTALTESPLFSNLPTSRFSYSTAPLTNIFEVRVRRRNGRCLGMHLTYEDSTVETLGQWDPRDKESIMKIYNANDGYLSRLVFSTRLEDNCLRRPQIELISVEVTANKSQPLSPGEDASDRADSFDPEIASTGESASCGRCRSLDCCNSTLRRESMLKAFRCSQPGQVGKFVLESLLTALLT